MTDTAAPPSAPALRYRCPECLVRYPTAGYVCLGGWPPYPADVPGGEGHTPRRVEPIPGLGGRPG